MNLWLRNCILIVIPVSQSANIGGDKSFEILFRWNILIHLLFPRYSPVSMAYPHHARIYAQNWNYFPNVKALIHRKGSKKNPPFFLVSFTHHQYGVPAVF
jgi:hypothetical protein